MPLCVAPADVWPPPVRRAPPPARRAGSPPARHRTARPHQVGAEEARQRVSVGEIEVPERGERQVDLLDVEVAPEHLLALRPRPVLSPENVEHRPRQQLDLHRLGDMPAALQVLVAEQGDEFRVLDVVAPGEGDQLVERLDRPARVECERALGLAELAVDALRAPRGRALPCSRSSSRSSGRSSAPRARCARCGRRCSRGA